MERVGRSTERKNDLPIISVKWIINVIESPNRVAFRGAVSQMGFSAFFFGDFLFGAAVCVKVPVASVATLLAKLRSLAAIAQD
jgi:hypothetical protein